MSGFRKLEVWQISKTLAVSVYKITSSEKFKLDFGLRDQIRRAAVSIPSNIAEGDERGSNKDAVLFFYIAKGSIAELQTQLEIAYEIGNIQIDILKELDDQCALLGKKLGSLIKARTAPNP